MMRIEPQKMLELPPPPEGWFLLSYSVSISGQLARMCATTDMRALWQRQSARAKIEGEPSPSLIPPGTRARIAVFDRLECYEGPEFELETRFPKFDRLPDGRWIVAYTRCPVGMKNARVIHPAGRVLDQLCLGDGIAHLQCDAEGGIWVGYFDEGVYGNFGWGGPGQPAPQGASGINRFDDAGRITWTYDSLGPRIDDCYAMNVGPDGTWLYFYSDFPLMRVQPDGRYRFWQNRAITGARVLAVEGDDVVLLGGYRENRNRGALLHLGIDQADLGCQFELGGAKGTPTPARFSAARGNEMHFVYDEAWYRITVGDIQRAR
jgi:hypothetical protein